MKMSLKGKMFLTGLEGICLSKYLDSVNVWTVGVGATKTEIPDLASWPRDKTLTIPECFDLLEKSLEDYENAVNKALKVDATQEQFDALVSIAYNIGVGGLARSTFIKRINAGASTENVVSAIMMWDRPKEIIGRRTKEAKLFSEGVYAGGGKALLFPVSANFHPQYSKGKIINLEDYFKDIPKEAPKTESKAPPVANTSIWDKLRDIFSAWLKS
jgi:lysozyme